MKCVVRDRIPGPRCLRYRGVQQRGAYAGSYGDLTAVGKGPRCEPIGKSGFAKAKMARILLPEGQIPRLRMRQGVSTRVDRHRDRLRLHTRHFRRLQRPLRILSSSFFHQNCHCLSPHPSCCASAVRPCALSGTFLSLRVFAPPRNGIFLFLAFLAENRTYSVPRPRH